MLNILTHQRSTNQNNSEIPYYTCQNGKDQKHDGNLCWRECGVRGTVLVGVQMSIAIMAISQEIIKQSTLYIPKGYSIIP